MSVHPYVRGALEDSVGLPLADDRFIPARAERTVTNPTVAFTSWPTRFGGPREINFCPLARRAEGIYSSSFPVVGFVPVGAPFTLSALLPCSFWHLQSLWFPVARNAPYRVQAATAGFR